MTTTDEAAPPQDVTLQCPDCEETVTGPEHGRNSALFRLAGHRVRAHGYRKADAQAKGPRQGKARARGVEGTAVTVLRAVGEGARPESGRKVTAPPTASDLSRGLGRGVQILTIVAASYAAETDPTLTTEGERDQLVRELSLSPGAAQDVMDPIANAVAPTSLNKKYGRQVIDNVDALASVGELVKLGFRWRRYFRMREAAIQLAAGAPQYMAPGTPGQHAPAGERVQAQPAPEQPPPPPHNAPPGVPLVATDDAGDHAITRQQYQAAQQAAPSPPVPAVGQQAFHLDGTPAAPSQGTVVTPDMVRQMRQGT